VTAGFLAMALASAAGGGWPPYLPTGAAPVTGQVAWCHGSPSVLARARNQLSLSD